MRGFVGIKRRLLFNAVHRDDIPDAIQLSHLLPSAGEQTAALVRRQFTRVRNHVVYDVSGNRQVRHVRCELPPPPNSTHFVEIPHSSDKLLRALLHTLDAGICFLDITREGDGQSLKKEASKRRFQYTSY